MASIFGIAKKGLGLLGKKSNKSKYVREPKKESMLDFVDRKSAEDPTNLIKSPGKILKNIGKATAVGTTAVVGTSVVKDKLKKNKESKK